MVSKPTQADGEQASSLPDETLDLLRLTLTPGLGATLTRRAIEALGNPRAVLGASVQTLATVPRIGLNSARTIWTGIRETDEPLKRELDEAHKHNVSFVSLFDARYPELLKSIPDPPVMLRVRGELNETLDRYALAIVGSRSCSVGAQEQTARFASFLASSGLTIVSGGARGIDTAAHRAALQAKGRTIVVMGCGLSHAYPPENHAMFESIVDSGGCIISELPMHTQPARENFPARNRIISGLSLGVLVAEAGSRSGALITARLAVEEHGREVMALPGTVGDARCAGTNALLRDGGAAMVLEPADVLHLLESPARHMHQGTHTPRFAPPPGQADQANRSAEASPQIHVKTSLAHTDLSQTQRQLLEALDVPRDFDDLARHTGLDAATLRSDATMLELRRLVARRGGALIRV